MSAHNERNKTHKYRYWQSQKNKMRSKRPVLDDLMLYGDCPVAKMVLASTSVIVFQ